MRSIFCTSCGAKNEYSSAKPKFCSSCGEPMAPSVASTKRNVASRRATRIQEVGDDETDAHEVPQVSSLAYDIEVPQNNIYKLSDILNEGQKEE